MFLGGHRLRGSEVQPGVQVERPVRDDRETETDLEYRPMPSNARDWMSSLSCRYVASDRNGVRAGSIESRYGAQGCARSVVAG